MTWLGLLAGEMAALRLDYIDDDDGGDGGDNYFHNIFPCDRIYSLIDAITSPAPLWLVSPSITPSKSKILRWM